MTTTIKITELTNIGANLASSTVIPVVNMAGTPTTEKTVLGNIANVVLAGAGGNYVAAAKANTATTANTVLTNAQPNITSVGTLSNVTVSGNASINGNITSNGTSYLGNISTTGYASITTLTVGSSANLGAVGNVRITGGTNGQVLTTNGSGNLSWTTVSSGSNGTPGGSNTQIQFNDAGSFGGNTGFTFDKTTGIFTSPFVAGNGNGLSNIQGANISGFVPNANVANTAYSVAVANVSGLGNIATANFDGNASNVLHGDGSWSADTTTYGNSNVVTLLSSFGSNTITTTGNVSVGNIIATNIGNISSINKDGNASNVLLGNGVFGGVPGSTPASIANGNSNVNIANGNGNVTITSNGTRNWTFDTTGNLTTAGDLIGPANANFTIHSNASAHEFIFGSDGTFYAPDNVVLGGNSIYIGPGANTLSGIEHEVFIASSNNFAYVQAVINNVSDNGSADWVALGARGNDTGGQASLGFTSSGFGDANYTITGNGDGYIFVQSYAPGQTLLGGGGNLVLTTGNQGTTKDIIFGTGGFLTSNIFGRISHANNSLEISRTGASLKFPDGSVQTTAYTGGAGAELVNGNNSFVLDSAGNVVFEGTPSGNAVDRGLVWDYGANANGVNSQIRQDLNGLTVRAWTENGGNYIAPVNIITGQDANTNTWRFDGQGNLTVPSGSINSISDGGDLGAYITLTPDLGLAKLASRDTPANVNYTNTSWISATYTGTQIDIVDAPDLVAFFTNNTFNAGVNQTISINGDEPVPFTGYTIGVSNAVTVYTSVTADPDPTTVTSIDFSSQLESYVAVDYDGGELVIGASGLTIMIDNDQTQGPDINIRSGDDILLQAKDKSLGSESEGGDINIYAGDGADDDGAGNISSTGGDIQITAGNGGDGNTSTGSSGGFTQIYGGTGGAAGVTSTAGSGGYVSINGGDGGYDNGNTQLGAGGGYVSINAGLSTQEGVNGPNVTITSGQGGPNALAGSVVISTPASVDGPGGDWVFDGYGNLTLPNNSNIATIGNVTQFNTCSNGFLGLNSYDAGGNNIASIAINSIDGLVGISTYDPITDSDYHWAFDDTGNLTLPGNTFSVNYANGTPVSIGGGGGNTGNVTFDNVTVQGVNGLNLSAGADFTANLAYLQVRAGDVASHIHLDTGNNSAYDLIVGDDQNYVQVSSTGNILLSSYDSNTAQYTWTLDYNGNLILAGGNSVIQSIATSSLDPINPNVSTMVLTPDPGYSSQALVLDPTSPGHIHLRAPSMSGNIDIPAANLFLGGEDTAFEITLGANNQAVIHSNGKAWTFGNDGNLTIPGTSGGFIKTVSNASIGVAAVDNGTNNPAQLLSINAGSGAATSIVSAYATNATIQTNATGTLNTWQFDNAGNLTLPTGGQIIVSGGLVSSGASPAPTINGFSITNSVGISGNGNIAGNNISATGQITSTKAGNLSDGGGQLYLNGSGNNRIDFNTNGTGAPSFTTRSAGAKVVLYPSIGASATDYAMGVDAGTLWSGIPAADAGQFFKWYAGTTEVANLNGTGMLTVIGNVTGGNIITGGVVSATGNVSGNFFLGNGSQLTGITATSLVNGTSNVVTTSNGNVTIGIAGNAAIATFTGTGANVTGTLNVTGNVTAQGVGTNLVRRANTISGSNTAVTLDNLNAYVGGTPKRLYIGAATSNMTMAGQSQTMSTGALAVSSWINVPIVTGVGNGFAMSGAITNDGDTAVLNVTDQGAGSGTWRVTGMIANTSANLYSVSIERLA